MGKAAGAEVAVQHRNEKKPPRCGAKRILKSKRRILGTIFEVTTLKNGRLLWHEVLWDREVYSISYFVNQAVIQVVTSGLGQVDLQAQLAS